MSTDCIYLYEWDEVNHCIRHFLYIMVGELELSTPVPSYFSERDLFMAMNHVYSFTQQLYNV